jgi:prepilin-type N-terminal cleavage/methylation domain-containing protein
MTTRGLPRSRRVRYLVRGFTLVELAVVVLVVGLLIGSLLVPLSTQVDQRNIAETQRRLEDARDALLGFAISNGRFPCPASASSNGTEAPIGGGNCGLFDGFVPGVTLGLNNLDAAGYLIDAWPANQSRIRYAIADVTLASTNHALTTNLGMRNAGINAIGGSTSYLSICASASGISATSCGVAANTLAGGNAMFVVYSLGKNGFPGTSADEQANTNGDAVFVSKGYSSGSSGEFDDQLLWVSSYTMISRLVAAGLLP